MNQSMQHLFAQIPRADIQRSVFDRGHTLKTAFNAGYLVPIFTDEVLPGDTFSLDLACFGRLSTMVVPVMDNIYMETFFFAVPNRLIWEHWKNFCGEQPNPSSSTAYVVPKLDDHAPTVGSLSDYLGLPVGVTCHNCSALYHRAYNLIYDEWFRDENLQNPAGLHTDDGPDPMTGQNAYYYLRKRGKRHDYFTSCLPWPQKGPGVEIPLMGNAPVFGTGHPLQFFGDTPSFPMPTNPVNGKHGLIIRRKTDDTLEGHDNTVSGADYGYKIPTKSEMSLFGAWSGNDPDTGLTADLSAVTAATINDLRTAFQIQRMYEADARGGKAA